MREQLFPQPAFLPEFSNYSSFQNKVIGLTGHQGVLGKILFDRLLDQEIEPIVFPGDITDNHALGSWFKEKRFDHFFHFAAKVPVTEVESDPLDAYETNVLATYNICKHLILSSPECWIFFASSSHVYGPTNLGGLFTIRTDGETRPMNFYGITKLSGERIVTPILEKYQISYCIGRIFSFSHSSQKGSFLVPSIISKISKLRDGEELELINPDSIRDIMDAESVIDAVLHLAAKRYRGTVNIGSGKGRTVKQIADIVQKHLGTNHAYKEKTHGEPDSLVADLSDLIQLVEQR